MKEKLEQAIKECLEKEEYFVRMAAIVDEDDSLSKDFIGHFVGTLVIRAKK